jgi:hypothetical protein
VIYIRDLVTANLELFSFGFQGECSAVGFKKWLRDRNIGIITYLRADS